MEERLASLESTLLEVQLELQVVRGDLQNVLGVARMSSEESQKAMLRMDNLEYDWLVWNDQNQAWPAGDDQPAPQREGVASGEVGGAPPPT